MVHQCANPTCGKPLRFLREGKIFVFDLPDAAATPGQTRGGRAARRLQHFWLCGNCSQTMMMVQNEGAQIQVKLMLGKVGSGKAMHS